MDQNENALFLSEMTDVVPLKQSNCVFNNEASQVTEAQLAKRAAAAQNEYLSKLPIDPALLMPIEPEEVVSYKLDGVQAEVFRHLRLGKYRYSRLIDLHAFRLSQAREYLIEQVLSSHSNGERNLLVIHGKGFKSKPYPGLMKSAVCHWLSQLDEVQAYHSATRERGGTGAVFVMLVKSDQKRIESSEMNRKGSGFR
ncbi:DNA endonuclease SmrA [Shewanella donghaensis]|uniref:DNA endonuclease SmrA n=1 Tax=Shewanella donghaensis TaxID=238836 RepID=UPI001182B08C|nr:DNA endonuclease SmrA [Shewanella donghaensis]